MQVYVELSFLENFCMDFTLLYCAKTVVKNRANIFYIAIASVLGACAAIIFPLLNLNSWASIISKLLSGLIICAVSGKFSCLKAYLKLTATFLTFSAVLAGALIAIFWLSGASYQAGAGYYISSVPIGIPLFGALISIIAAKKIAKKLKKIDKAQVECTIFYGEKQVKLSGFFDSGNSVYYLGEPVCVIPLCVSQKIIDQTSIESFVKIHTVAESKKLKIFTADKLQIKNGEKIVTYDRVKIAITPYANQAILHPDYAT